MGIETAFKFKSSGLLVAFAVGAVALLAFPVSSNAQQNPVSGAIGGAAEGTYEGKKAAGPVGGLVGGVLGAGVGVVTGTISGVVGTTERIVDPSPVPPPPNQVPADGRR